MITNLTIIASFGLLSFNEMFRIRNQKVQNWKKVKKEKNGSKNKFSDGSIIRKTILTEIMKWIFF
jgi:hypothetical protein